MGRGVQDCVVKAKSADYKKIEFRSSHDRQLCKKDQTGGLAFTESSCQCQIHKNHVSKTFTYVIFKEQMVLLETLNVI